MVAAQRRVDSWKCGSESLRPRRQGRAADCGDGTVLSPRRQVLGRGQPRTEDRGPRTTMRRVAALFKRLRKQKRCGLIAYVTCGDPDRDTTAHIVAELE